MGDRAFIDTEELCGRLDGKAEAKSLMRDPLRQSDGRREWVVPEEAKNGRILPGRGLHPVLFP
jgi:hypothetical protein